MRRILFISIAAGCLAVAVASCSNSSQKPAENNSVVNAVSPEDIVKRGEYLVTIMGCNDCHPDALV